MKFDYEFSNLIGTVYHRGNVVFVDKSDVLIAPVGNKITAYDLKEHHSETFPIESQFNVVTVALDNAGANLLAVNEKGEGLFINLKSRSVLHRHRFNKQIKCIKFSPDGKRFAVCRDTDVQVFRSPGNLLGQFNPFFLEQVYHVANDQCISLDWSCDSKIFAVGAKDMQTRVCAAQRYQNMFMYSLAGHTSPITACFFEKDTFDLYTLDKRGFLVCWECQINSSQLIPQLTPGVPQSFSTLTGQSLRGEEETVNPKDNLLHYKLTSRHSFHDIVGNGVLLTCADYHKSNHLLVTGFSSGAFILHEMPEFNMIHNLSISDYPIKTVSLNASGDWIALGCTGIGQLLVWEWQSETYVMKQQGHIQNMQCLSYSPDGHSIATGGQDGKLKIWSENTGFCFVTFTEHTSTITGVVWTEGGKAIISASLDGTVRAFDMKRYRNFRTFTSTKNMQFSCIAVDSSSELLCAGTQDDFVVCLWSIKTGRLLDMLSGHTAPVSSVVFAPTDSILASVSWDKTVHVWDVCNSGSGKESLKLQAEGLCAKFSPDGGRLAVATMNSKIIVYDWKNATEVCSIDGKFDLDPGRADRDIISVAKSAPSKSFTTLAFTADGEYLLAGGQSRHICIYHVEEAVIVRKYQITSNLSLDAIADDIDRRKMSEFGNLALIDMSDSDVSDDELREQRKLKLPGTRTGDYSQRRGKPEVNVTSVQFSPTGRCFACCSTEGLLLYSLDKSVHFDPFLLDQSITPDNIRLCVRKSEFSTALVMAIKLNEKSILCDVIERTPSDQVQVIAQNMPLVLIERFLRFLSNRLSESECRCLELYLTWINLMFRYHGPYLKTRSIDFIATFTAFQQSLNRKLNDLSKVSQFNNSSTAYITSILQLKQKKKLKMQVDKTDIDDIDDVLIG